MIRLIDVTKIYPGGLVVFRHLNLELQLGDCVLLTGDSGSGKSTLIKMLALLENLTQGQYWLAGKRVDQLSKSEQAKIRSKYIGYMPQDYRLLMDESVYTNVLVGLLYAKHIPRWKRKGLVQQVLHQVHLDKQASQKVGQLSGGQQARVALARALVCQAPILLMDEPTAALPKQLSLELLDLIPKKNHLVLIVSHQPELIEHNLRIDF